MLVRVAVGGTVVLVALAVAVRVEVGVLVLVSVGAGVDVNVLVGVLVLGAASVAVAVAAFVLAGVAVSTVVCVGGRVSASSVLVGVDPDVAVPVIAGAALVRVGMEVEIAGAALVGVAGWVRTIAVFGASVGAEGTAAVPV